MDKAKINYWVDVGLALSFIIAAITGVVKWPGLIGWFGLAHRQLPMLFLTTVHDWSGLVMIVLVLLHLVLHWRWMICMTKNLFKKKGDSQ